MLRDPNNLVNADDLPAIADHSITWHTLHCELVTPMYGGGVEAATVDKTLPIRAMSIRGALRFWWRLLAKHKWKINDIATAETNLWGGIARGSDDGKASKVLIRVDKMPSASKVENNLIEYSNAYLKNLKYVLFTADNAKDSEINPHKLLKPDGISWELSFAFLPTVSEEQKQQVIETLQWWANFGGLGFRSRKGLGAVHVSHCPDYPQICEILTDKEVASANCQLVQRTSTTNAMTALETAVQKLLDFRQKAGVGRNNGQSNHAGRSRWPEPDALRRIQNNLPYDPRHKPEHPAGNIFPRAVFGLPILFHSHQEEAVNATAEPSIGERLASPLLLRPTYAGKDGKGNKRWAATALVLPYDDVLDRAVKVNGKEYPIWQKDKAKDIKPITDNGGGDPLQAFLRYFVN